MVEKTDPNIQMLEELPRHLTYSAVVDVRLVEDEITDWMVRRACQEMDIVQQFPFAVKNQATR